MQEIASERLIQERKVNYLIKQRIGEKIILT